tara:strand:+ start:136 stop:483 length:348 start_codon:yes stop_codon:yes gene_type:complete
MPKDTMKEMLKMIDAKINHIEDITADNREVIIKLVKQSNQIVKFLSQIEIEDITDDYSDMSNLSLSKTEKVDSERMEYIKNMVDTYMNKQKELKELEDELKKYKNEITPGQIGES